MSKSAPQPPLTKKRFERLLKKAAQPISGQVGQVSDLEVKRTSVAHRADGCIGKRKNQGKTVSKED